MLGLRFCARAFSSCGKWGPLFIAVRGPLTIAASLVAEHRLQTRRLSSCGSRAQLLRSMWDLPGPGLEPLSPALAGRFSTTVPPGKPNFHSYFINFGFFSLSAPPPRDDRCVHIVIFLIILLLIIWITSYQDLHTRQGFRPSLCSMCYTYSNLQGFIDEETEAKIVWQAE